MFTNAHSSFGISDDEEERESREREKSRREQKGWQKRGKVKREGVKEVRKALLIMKFRKIWIINKRREIKWKAGKAES